MKRIPYLKPRNGRIRYLIVLGLSMILTVFVVGVLVVSEEITALELSVYGFLYVVICVPIMILPFGNILESHGKEHLVSYFQVGPFRFDKVTHEKARPVHIEQDEKKRYCLTIDYAGNKKMVIERYPTREMAEDRLGDFTY